MLDSAGARQCVHLDTRMARVFRLRKGVMTSARLINDRLSRESIRWRPLMVTLTYAPGVDWRPDHVTDFLRRVHMYGKRRGFKLPYVWVMELHKSGVPHYHVILWVPARWRLPQSDRRGWWPHGMTNTVRVRNAVGYVAKYASKLASKDAAFPKGARIHGIGGITGLERRIIAWWKLPKDLRTGEEGSVAWRRAKGGGWSCQDTGEYRPPSWGLMAIASDHGIVALAEIPPGTPRPVMAPSWRQTVAEYAGVRRRLIQERNEDLMELQQTDWPAYVLRVAGEVRQALAFSTSL